MITAEDLAREFGVSGKTLRSWLRRNRAHRHGDPWVFSRAEADAVRHEYRMRETRRERSISTIQCTVAPSHRSGSDEAYVVGLCEVLLDESASRQHRFEWLVGDRGKDGRCRPLPVDAFFPSHGIVVEYHEPQHSEPVAHFDKPGRMTVSGVDRGEQRRIYDQRRVREVPAHGLRLVIVDHSDLDCDARIRLTRDRPRDLTSLWSLLACGAPGPGSAEPRDTPRPH